VSVFDVAIVGGGVIGSSIAFELASEKLSVVLLDRQQPGHEASWAAAGMLSPGPDSADAPALTPLSIESFRLYPEFITSIEAASGRSTTFLRQGTLQVFPGPHAEAESEKMAAEYRKFGLQIEPISLDAARKLEEALGPAVRAAAWIPEEGVVDPRLLMDAVLAAARRHGVEIRTNCSATAIVQEGVQCKGVIAGGEKISAGSVVVAAGSFTGGIDWLARYAPTRPVRGQMLALRPKGPGIRRVVRSEAGYLVPRVDGRIIAGSTLEDVGFSKHVTPGGISKILEAALQLVPGLADAEIIETWAGLRPGTPDNLPVLGPTDIEGLFIATGHYRNGILLAPVTARLLHDWILGRPVKLDTKVFSPLRFSQNATQDAAPKRASAIH
jgi:glycine oxidase